METVWNLGKMMATAGDLEKYGRRGGAMVAGEGRAEIWDKRLIPFTEIQLSRRMGAMPRLFV